ncbi:MAG: hypothetical protein SVR04_02505 [Spirochaetota bacterium]|nr:hypothetical protein [Spirochaetota bacterium]
MRHSDVESNNPRVETSEELNPIVVPVKLYEFFMANGKTGLEAMRVWLHLVYTARKQHTNQVWALNTYLQKGTGFGERKIKECKAWLHKHNLITYVQRKESGTQRITQWFIRVHGSKQATGAEIDPVEEKATGAVSTGVAFHPCGFDGQMLKDNNQMLKTNNKGGGS